MDAALDDVTNEHINPAEIRKRVEDWKDRLNGLYNRIRGFLPEGWEARSGIPLEMNEQMMSNHGIKPTSLPTLDLVGEGDRIARVSPRGLWIVGTNGRVDLKYGDRRYLIVDIAGRYETPEWQAMCARHRLETQQNVSPEWLAEILR